MERYHLAKRRAQDRHDVVRPGHRARVRPPPDVGQRIIGDERQLILGHADLAERARHAEAADQPVEQYRRRHRRIAEAGADAHLPVADDARVPRLDIGGHDARRMPVRHVARPAEHVADRVAGAHRHTGDDRNHRLPRADLAFQPRIEIAGVGLDAGQAGRQQPQRAVGDAVAIVVRLERGERLGRVIDGADAGRQPQPFRRVDGDRGIEHDGDRNRHALLIALLLLDRLVGRPRQRVELAARQRRRHADHPHVRRIEHRRDHRAVGLDAGAEGVEALDCRDIVLEEDRDDLARVGDRAAADRDDQVGTRRARRIGRRQHVAARRVRLDAVVSRGMTVAERRLDPPDLVGLAIERHAGQDEHAPRVEALGLRRERRRRRLAQRHPLGRGQNDRRSSDHAKLPNDRPHCRVPLIPKGSKSISPVNRQR